MNHKNLNRTGAFLGLLREILEEEAAARPDAAPAMADRSSGMTHGDPRATVERTAAALQEAGLRRGDRTADSLYFIGRRDEMIKTSGYRVSPTEIREEACATGLVTDGAALGIPH